MFDFLFEYQNDIKYCTWEPDPVDTGSWGMFIDDFPPELFDKVVEFLESENSWILEEEVEMSLDDDENNVYREYLLRPPVILSERLYDTPCVFML